VGADVSKNATHARRLAGGKCQQCGSRDRLDGRVLCVECAETKAEDQRQRIKKRRDRGMCATCGKKRSGAKFSCVACREKGRARQRVAGPKHRKKIRDAVFGHYGGYMCRCCSLNVAVVLSIDHVDGGGCQHEKEIGKLGGRLYAWIVRHGFPSGFQVLCFNCNVGKYRNGGICPIHGTDLRTVGTEE
jgi:hypothetical protein